MNPELAQEIVNRLIASPWEKRGMVADEYCSTLGWSKGKFWRIAKQAGYVSNRKKRIDNGSSKKVESEKIKKAAAVIERTRRKTGTVNMPTWNLLLHFEDNHIKMPSEGTVNRHLREMGISRKRLASPEPTVPLKSLHPNHVHLIDASVCVMWDFKGNKKLATRDMQKEFYKNKPGFWREVKKVILRYICTDHTTGWFFVYYYYSKGEDFKNLFDFTMRAWGVKENTKIFPAHGVPYILMLDKGAANISRFYRNLMKNLKVDVHIHTPGKPWISGSVETHHGWWERVFEGDLSLLEIKNLDELNKRALDKCAYINALRTHSRYGTSRFEAFQKIKPEQLRILPPVDVCKHLCHTDAEQVTVNGYNQIRYDNNFYYLHRSFRRGDKLWVRYNPYDYPNVEINTREDFMGEVVTGTLIQKDSWGFPTNAAIIGQEYKSHKWDATRRFKEEMKGIDVSDVVPQLQAEKIEKIAWMPKKGHELIPAAEIKIPPMTAHEARKRLRGELGIERFTVLQSQWLDMRLTETISEERYSEIIEEYKQRFLKEQEGETPDLKIAAIGR